MEHSGQQMKALEKGSKASLYKTVWASMGTDFARNLLQLLEASKSSIMRLMSKRREKRSWSQALSDSPATMCIAATRIYTTKMAGCMSGETSGMSKWQARCPKCVSANKNFNVITIIQYTHMCLLSVPN